jgi:hypothetical protein
LKLNFNMKCRGARSWIHPCSLPMYDTNTTMSFLICTILWTFRDNLESESNWFGRTKFTSNSFKPNLALPFPSSYIAAHSNSVISEGLVLHIFGWFSLCSVTRNMALQMPQDITC